MPIWYPFKQFLEHATGFDMDALHVLVGVGLQLGLALFLRTDIGRWRPWLIVFGLEILNEINDLWVERWPDPAHQYGEGFKDILLTMILPTLLLLAVRCRPALFIQRFAADDPSPGGAEAPVPPTA
ncbi:hypothetical protein HMF7854_08160 [Sphingomonas ginkgonis]|uniref:Uncharacterized protein n=1 Tax=Sphingomonas ginkgonis TaxID=2315330 RepID=A0A429VA31_9SPHN|nr:hypothetical protein [Sphingomonas ginkgonis]RST30814.1 hypothetical protein HMF7854_08160 [Sphingomonas ginkgonis]